jgi:hypothetical protein
VEFVERNMVGTSDQDFMSIRTQLATKMEEEEKRHRQLSLKPSAIADITCNLPSPFIIPECLGVVYSQSSRPELFNMNINSVELGSPVKVSLAAPTASLEDVSASLKCVADPSSSLEGEVVSKGVGRFSISVTPKVRGRHDLIVKVKGKDIVGSPFRIFVKISPSKLRLVQPYTIGGLSNPRGIAINNKGRLMVIENSEIAVIERGGSKSSTIKCEKFKDPRGIVAASNGAVYVTDITAKCLFKFNSKGNLLKTVQSELQTPSSIKIIENQLYVVDTASQLVKIFDMDSL